MTPVETKSCPFWTEGLVPGIEINLLLVFFWKLVQLTCKRSAEVLPTLFTGAAILLLMTSMLWSMLSNQRKVRGRSTNDNLVCYFAVSGSCQEEAGIVIVSAWSHLALSCNQKRSTDIRKLTAAAVSLSIFALNNVEFMCSSQFLESNQGLKAATHFRFCTENSHLCLKDFGNLCLFYNR